MRVLFVSTGLATGGAEKQLAGLLALLHGKGVRVGVVSLASPGPVSKEIAAFGIPVWHLGLDHHWRLPLAAVQIVTLARRFRPDVMQGWMYHANLAAHWAARATGWRVPVVWGVRQSLYDIRREKPMTQGVIRLSVRLSAQAAAIVYNAEVARTQHEHIGFASSRGLVIGNGFDAERWQPDAQARLAVRAELGLAADTPLIGIIARYHPMKGHEVFLEAARLLVEEQPNVHFLLAGKGVMEDTPVFAQWLSEYPMLAGCVHLLGERRDIPRLTAALDVASSSSSWGEAFSNAIAEALLCAVPVVATAVGDASAIVGDAGRIVPPGDSQAMARAWRDLLAMDSNARCHLGMMGRDHVRAHFGRDAIVKRYLDLYREMAI